MVRAIVTIRESQIMKARQPSDGLYILGSLSLGEGSSPKARGLGGVAHDYKTRERGFSHFILHFEFEHSFELNMASHGKGGKGLGKGGAKRHRKVLRDNIQGITEPAIRRLARRGGAKRVSGLTVEYIRYAEQRNKILATVPGIKSVCATVK